MGINFLVVDPEVRQRESLRGALQIQFQGSEVMEAEDGKSALRCLGTAKVHGILCAWRMPGLDGEGLVQALRRNQVLARKPVIVFGADVESRQAYKQDDRLCFLEAPPSATILGGILRGYLEEKISDIAPSPASAIPQKKILFVSVNASVRGPMAEGLAAQHLGLTMVAASAGFRGNGVHPFAVRVMAEISIDISGLPSRCVRELDLSGVETVVNLCYNEIAPMVAGRFKRYDWPVPDPLKGPSGEEAILERMRQARDSMARRIQRLSQETPVPVLAS